MIPEGLTIGMVEWYYVLELQRRIETSTVGIPSMGPGRLTNSSDPEPLALWNKAG